MQTIKRVIASSLLGMAMVAAAGAFETAAAAEENCHWAWVKLADGTVVREYHCH